MVTFNHPYGLFLLLSANWQLVLEIDDLTPIPPPVQLGLRYRKELNGHVIKFRLRLQIDCNPTVNYEISG